MTEKHHPVADMLTRARTLAQSGRLEESAAMYRQLLALQPDSPSIYHELGMVKFRQGDYQSAIEHLRNAIEMDADRPGLHIGLGIALSASGDLSAGARCFEHALELDSGNALACNNLGSNYREQGRSADAIAWFRKAVELKPRYLSAWANLGRVLFQTGELPAAAEAYRAALSIDPGSLPIQFELAIVLHLRGEYPEAVALFRKVEAGDAEFPGLYNNLGLAIARLGDFEGAIACFRLAIEKEPHAAAPHVSLGNALQEKADLQGAVASFRNALAIRPDHSTAHSNLLLLLNYLPDVSQEQLYKEALEFEAQQTAGVKPVHAPFGNSPDKDRVLRIGYVSPNFTGHSVSHFVRKLFGAHDRRRVEVFCYTANKKRDAITDEIEEQADQWRSIVGQSDDVAAARIRDDNIDILVDLAGHTGNNSLLVFARRPAPIQVSWLGYPNTTGLSCIDYRLTDAIADPPGVGDQWYSEELVRLPNGFLCFQSDQPEPTVAASPHLAQGHITFGSFNNLPKMTPDVVRTWARILNATPDSRLILKSSALADKQTCERALDEFGAHGVAADRVELLGLMPGRERHLAAYARIDVALDPFPYNGTTTTCEALWMGVPVVTLRGERHSGRVGASILHHVGVPELVAESAEDYVDTALALARDSQRLVTLRQELRPMMRESVLMDTPRFARSLERAYRDMWKRWCDEQHR